MNVVLLDLDGTLTDPAQGIVACMQHAIRELSGPTWTDADLEAFIGPPLHVSFQRIFRTDNTELVSLAVQRYRDRFATIGLYENEVYPGVPDALATLRERGFRLFVATSKPTCYAERIIDHFELGRFLERVYGSELSGERTGKSELLAYILQREGIAASSACMVGDRRHDVEGARAQGIPALGVLWGYGTSAELASAGAHALVEEVADLPSSVIRLGRSSTR